MSSYTYKRIDETAYNDLVYLYQSAFKQSTTVNYYRKKFDTAYLGVKHLGFIAYDAENKPAAFYGVYPYPVEYNGKQYLAAQSGDTMTHPDHVGRGLFTTLAKQTYELAKQEGIQFVFGFPNDNSLPGFVKKLNWTHTENMHNYEFAVFTFPLAALAKKIPFLGGLYNFYSRVVLGFFKTSAQFQPSSVLGHQYGSVIRSAAYHRYKSFYQNHLVNVGNRTAWVKVDGALMVGDIELKNENKTSEVISALKRLAFWLGCTKVIFPVGADTAWDLLLKQQANPVKGIHIGYVDLQSGLPLQNFKYVLADFDTF